MLRIRNNKNLLTLKIFGFSNFKIFLILAIAAFITGWIVLFIASLSHLRCLNIMKKQNLIIQKK